MKRNAALLVAVGLALLVSADAGSWLGLTQMQATHPDLAHWFPTFRGGKLIANNAAFVGSEDAFQLSADQVTVNYNDATEWDANLGKPAIDWAASFPAESIVDEDGDGDRAVPRHAFAADGGSHGAILSTW